MDKVSLFFIGHMEELKNFPKNQIMSIVVDDVI